MLKELAESIKKLVKPTEEIHRRKKRTKKEETKTEGDQTTKSYKNPTELFADKTIAFIYVLACKWAYRNRLEDSTLIVVQEIHALAMKSISKIGEGDENYALKEVLGLLDKNEGHIKTPNDQLRLRDDSLRVYSFDKLHGSDF